MSKRLEEARQRVVETAVRYVNGRMSNAPLQSLRYEKLEDAVIDLKALYPRDGGRMNPDSIGEQS